MENVGKSPNFRTLRRPYNTPALPCECVMLCCCFLLYFSVIWQRNYLDIYRTDLYENRKIDRNLAVDERSQVIYSIAQETLLWQPILWAKSTSKLHVVVCVTFAKALHRHSTRRAICYAGHRPTDYLILWTQANQFSDSLIIINRRRGR